MKEQIDQTIIKILKGIASEKEISNFSEWIKNYKNEQYFFKIKEMWHVSTDTEYRKFLNIKSSKEHSQREKLRFINYIRSSKRKERGRRLFLFTVSTAATLLLLAGLFSIYKNSEWGVNRDFNTLAYSKETVKVELHSGELIEGFKRESKAMTILDSILIPSKEEAPDQQQEITDTEPKPKVYNSVTTPPGERVAMILSDGTRVYLTSNSYLRYPANFDSHTRDVTLVGRAYFEVSKSDVPFVVNTSDMDIQVLGTSFDVESRISGSISNVILVEGSVKVLTKTGSQIIRPNEQFSYDRVTKEESVTNVNSRLLTMWKDGVLIVRGQTFEELLESLSSWYGVKIIDQTSVSERERFNGRFDREDIEAAIKAVSISARIKYKIINGNLVLNDI